MPRARRFRFVDGREVVAASAFGFFQSLRESEPRSIADMDHYLDLLCYRISCLTGVEIDFGRVGEDDSMRCRTALASLMSHGLVRVDSRPIASGPSLMLC